MRCPACQSLIPPHGRHCPKCGKPAAKPPLYIAPQRAADAIPARGPLPRSGKLLLAAVAIGMTLAGLGIYWRLWILCAIGAGLIALIVILLIILDHLGI